MGAAGDPRFARKLMEATSATTTAAGMKPTWRVRAMRSGIRAMTRLMGLLWRRVPACAVRLLSISEAIVDLGIDFPRRLDVRAAESLAVVEQQAPIGKVQD